MPTLATALRESGLTLTGGGVFQQAQQNTGDGSGHQGSNGSAGGRSGGNGNGRDGGDADALGSVSSAAALRRARLPGAVDVYA